MERPHVNAESCFQVKSNTERVSGKYVASANNIVLQTKNISTAISLNSEKHF